MGITLMVLAFRDVRVEERSGDFFNGRTFYLIQAVILLTTSILSIIYPDYLLRIIIGIVLIIIPSIKLLFEVDKKRYLKNNFWKYIVGILFVLASDGILNVIFIIIGLSLILVFLAGVYLVVINYRHKDNANIITKYITRYIIYKNDRE
jgi:hypothetical protein